MKRVYDERLASAAGVNRIPLWRDEIQSIAAELIDARAVIAAHLVFKAWERAPYTGDEEKECEDMGAAIEAAEDHYISRWSKP